MSLFSAVIQPSKAVIAKLLGDPNFGEIVTYRRFTGQQFDPQLGYNVAATENTTLSAVRLRHTRDSVKVAQSDVEIGDTLFLFSAEEFPEDATLKDTIELSSGSVLGIKGLDRIFDIAVVVTVLEST